MSYAQAFLEVPQQGSFQSGTGMLSGWSCSGPVSIEIDGVPFAAAYGTARADAASQCGGNANIGFGLLTSYNLFSTGAHSAQLVVNGSKVGSPVQFNVTVPGGNGNGYLQGLARSVSVPDFPSAGKTTNLVWQEPLQNFAIASTTSNAAGTDTLASCISATAGKSFSYMAYNATSYANFTDQIAQGSYAGQTVMVEQLAGASSPSNYTRYYSTYSSTQYQMLGQDGSTTATFEGYVMDLTKHVGEKQTLTWTKKFASGGTLSAIEQKTFEGVETLTLAGKTFRACKVTSYGMSDSPSAYFNTEWFAAGYGALMPIKASYTSLNTASATAQPVTTSYQITAN